ncbi:uncharacterized protein [Aegilops tauschii subsp. strangulata]|uniref:uncharacterized protein isoform X5 n=1 Tax=Aegilops tauschii subsp. strangulata TaxID=200361 RepID=UPI003CC8B065
MCTSSMLEKHLISAMDAASLMGSSSADARTDGEHRMGITIMGVCYDGGVLAADTQDQHREVPRLRFGYDQNWRRARCIGEHHPRVPQDRIEEAL